jgi:hypothetical protein
MAQRSVRRAATEIDPMFEIPEGVDELVYIDEGYEVDDDELDGTGDGTISIVDETDGSQGPETIAPYIKGIIEQIVRRQADGSQVIDVVLDVTDIFGANDYEVRLDTA